MPPTNIPGPYDEARAARLQPIRSAIEQLGLPIVRFRKLNGILGALAMQIEDGGDSPEVNAHLLAALRAAVIHQVGEAHTGPIMAAIDAFERSELEWRAQAATGAASPAKRPSPASITGLVHEGYHYLHFRQQAVAACEQWLAAWDIVEPLIRPDMRSTEDFKAVYPDRLYRLNDWCVDLMYELHNAGLDDSIYTAKRLAFTRAFLEHFPDEDADTQVEFYRGQGESLWALARRGEAEAAFAEVVQRFPDHAWGYIGWADHYWLFNESPGEYARAESILHRALARPGLDRPQDVLERLIDLYDKWGKPAERDQAAEEFARFQTPIRQPIAKKLSTLWTKPQATVQRHQPRPSRNAPCWCGSGKKYKQCHMKSDREGGETRR